MKLKYIVSIVICLFAVTVIFRQDTLLPRRPKNSSFLIGFKIYPQQHEFQQIYKDSFRPFLIDIQQIGCNAVFFPVYEYQTAFYHSQILPYSNDLAISNLVDELHKSRIAFGIICPVFLDPERIQDRPDLIPIDQNGTDDYTNWQKMVCPSDSAFRKQRLQLIAEIVRKFHPDYLNLDFVRYPCTWEEIRLDAAPESVRNFCYCPRCLDQFQKYIGNSIPSDSLAVRSKSKWIDQNYSTEWVAFKTDLIADFVHQASYLAKSISPDIHIIIHTLPWLPDLFGNGILSIVGQDMQKMAAGDISFAPMLYHDILGVEPQYIRKYLASYSSTNYRLLPSIQISSLGNLDTLTVSEFASALEMAAAPPSRGIILFHWSSLSETHHPSAQTKLQIIADFIRTANSQ